MARGARRRASERVHGEVETLKREVTQFLQRLTSAGVASSYKRSSCPGLSRASTFLGWQEKVVDGRDKPGHDAVGAVERQLSSLVRLPPDDRDTS